MSETVKCDVGHMLSLLVMVRDYEKAFPDIKLSIKPFLKVRSAEVNVFNDAEEIYLSLEELIHTLDKADSPSFKILADFAETLYDFPNGTIFST